MKDGSLQLRTPCAVVVWNVATGQEQQRMAAEEWTSRPATAVSPNGRHFAVVDRTGSIQVWDVTKGKLAFPALKAAAGLTGVAFSPDSGRLAAAGLDDRVRLYDAEAGHELLELHSLGVPGTGHYGFTARVAFSPDGRRIAANGWDGTVTVWSLSGR
jgi:WD40 repeat protein